MVVLELSVDYGLCPPVINCINAFFRASNKAI
jgi:hypothetical protein